MNLNQPTLVQFESVRRENNIVPPLGSNSFYTIGDGEINIFVKRNNPEDYRFDILTNKGIIFTGTGNFKVSGDIIDNNQPYNDITIITDTKFCVTQLFTISKGNLDVHGTLELLPGSQFIISDNANVILYSDSTFVINDNTQIMIQNGSSLTIYGNIQIHLNKVNDLINTPGVIIDSAAVMQVNGLEVLGNRIFSLTDYYTELSNRTINVHTQGEKNFSFGRIGFTWISGDPLNGSQHIKMSVMWGKAILGDFKLSILGLPEVDIPNLQIISDLHIQKNTTLYISEEFEGKRYVQPKLYLGVIIGNNKRPGSCIIDGTVIVDGKNSIINIDRGATMTIGETGELYIKNEATLLCTYNEGIEVLFINGTLIIDTIDQIKTFDKDNIVLGPKGKVIILNPDTGEKKLLWTTPNGIEDSDLYRLFKDRIDQVEYHVSKNNGIGIDKYFEYYSTQMTNWYGGRRIEKAIHDGILVWHDGGFIELYHDIIPWVDVDCTLLHAARLFKTYGSYDKDKLQDAVNRLKYAGCGNILFRFINGDNVGEITMVLEGIEMENVINYPLTDKYILTTSNSGKLFLKNKIGAAIQKNIINNNAKVIEVENKEVEFPLK